MNQLRQLIKEKGSHHPKKHGHWYRLCVWDSHYLVWDTWNNQVYHYKNGAQPSDTNNMYQVVYVFYSDDGHIGIHEKVLEFMEQFWIAHIKILT